ncbi:MAG: indole-3-glycerol phosphate synthase TrpC [Candidatus Omnitrophica bacterium]|nr:indole-3-glycerol phosphate synthase TrpC [Candidatus Omnitrophota bacterium]MCM8827113.1 indole-3-glycerol phosphate synthase TrpC [Candidatus Omnitrophota bacterium]
MHNILSLILESRKKKVEILRKNRDNLSILAKKSPPPKSFKRAIHREGKISFIAELKQASLSSGVLRKDFDIKEIARTFIDCKVNAISVLTEEEFFLGKTSFLAQIRELTDIPILRKDFIIDEVQVLESRVAGADAILLIARILDNRRLTHLYEMSKDLGMDVLVEIHTSKELKRILPFKFDIIGINNRSLDTLEVDLNTTNKLVSFIPNDVVKVSESGIKERKDMLWLKGLGIDAALVGETLMKAFDIANKIRELMIDG